MIQALDAGDWLQADLRLACVTGDPIDILLKNRTFAYTNLQGGTCNKLITRQGLRGEIS